jgi:antitoxin (DNA-binding transcriptional repressor) of toxin-antitoxin stability system
VSTITLQEAKSHLSEILHSLQPGVECTILEAGLPLAQLKKLESTSWPCQGGSAKGKIRMAPDFDAPLDEFKEYAE